MDADAIMDLQMASPVPDNKEDTPSTASASIPPPSPVAITTPDCPMHEPAHSPAPSETDPSRDQSSPKDPTSGAPKPTKRRAARACASCRARKVRCDVVEQMPCSNCRWDKVTCVLQESKRRKKGFTMPATSTAVDAAGSSLPVAPVNVEHYATIQVPGSQPIMPMPPRLDMSNLENVLLQNPEQDLTSDALFLARFQQAQLQARQQQNSNPTVGTGATAEAINAAVGPGAIPGTAPGTAHDPLSWANPIDPSNLPQDVSWIQNFVNSLETPDPLSTLPAFINPLPNRIGRDDIKYLHAKGALTLPSLPLQNALLRAFAEFVHPYMPLLDLTEFLSIINDREGAHGQVSLLLYQAVMFSATAFVDLDLLKLQGFNTRKDARRAFFYKARHLYDLDYESDRLVLVQSLLLMTYWYETPDDQKDTWHWMGVAISLAHTIGLHRDPSTNNLPVEKQRLFKRIWWSCFMRDRLVALGMRRPTRIQDEDFDVPMLVEDDFKTEPLSDDVTVVPNDCVALRDADKKYELAQMCIAKAKLCTIIGHVLKLQYSVLIRDRTKADDTMNSTMMLFPNKTAENIDNVNVCDKDLMSWLDELPSSCHHRPLGPDDAVNGNGAISVQRNVLHMVYYTAVSALHRPQFLPSSPTQVPTASKQTQEMSRMRVRNAATQVTHMAAELHQLNLDLYLHTTGVTVMLPAMIIQLLDMKNVDKPARNLATVGFKQCMLVMERLKVMYAAADFATRFLDAALKKVSIDIHEQEQAEQQKLALQKQQQLKRREQFPAFRLGGRGWGGRFGGGDRRANKIKRRRSDRSEVVDDVGDMANAPLVENAPYMSSSELKLFHQSQMYAQSGARGSGSSSGMAASATGGRKGTAGGGDKDFDSAVGLTPSVGSGMSEHGGTVADVEYTFGNSALPLDGMEWNAVTAGGFDAGLWPHFTTEGGSAESMEDLTGILDLLAAEQGSWDVEQGVREAAVVKATDEMMNWGGEEGGEVV